MRSSIFDAGQPLTSFVSVSVSQACGFTPLSLQVSISEATIVGAAFVAAGEKCVLPVQRDRADAALDCDGIDRSMMIRRDAPADRAAGDRRISTRAHLRRALRFEAPFDQATMPATSSAPVFSQERQAYFGRRVTSTRSLAGT